jgi:pimeloyl-ACP methyl ester carboxylesterase
MSTFFFDIETSNQYIDLFLNTIINQGCTGMSIATTFMLVHGSCHGGWCWQKVTPLLRNHGYKVYTPTLTGLGERSHIVRKDIDLNTHILDITQVFEYEDLNDVILVGHSYGGMVISGVAEKIPHSIKRLLYLDGYIPQDGKSAFDLIPGLKEIYEKRSMKQQGKEWLVSSYEPQIWGVTNPEDIAWMRNRLCPMPWHTHDQPLRMQNIQSKKLAKSYISCTDFKDFHFMAQRVKSEEGGVWDCHELKTGHDAMVTVPNELVQLLLEISIKQ